MTRVGNAETMIAIAARSEAGATMIASVSGVAVAANGVTVIAALLMSDTATSCSANAIGDAAVSRDRPKSGHGPGSGTMTGCIAQRTRTNGTTVAEAVQADMGANTAMAVSRAITAAQAGARAALEDEVTGSARHGTSAVIRMIITAVGVTGR
jgi:hypothetical protein